MTLGMHFALCIQGSQRALQLGFCYFLKATHGLDMSKEATGVIASLDRVDSNSEIEIVTILHA